MGYKESINIEEIKDVTNEIFSSILALDEYGHCTVAGDEQPKLKIRGEKLIQKLNECKDELELMRTEMVDWYGY